MKDLDSTEQVTSIPRSRLSGLRTMPSQDANFDDALDVLGLLRALWHRKALIAAICLATSLAFFAFAMLQERSFTATATVMLDPREQHVVATQDQVVSNLKLNAPILESEVAIVRSNALLQEAIQRVGLDTYNGIDPARVRPSLFQSLRGSIMGGSLPAEPGPLSAEQIRMNRVVVALRPGMSVRRVGDSYVIEIKINTNNPSLSAATANALAEAYIARQLQDRRRAAESATAWLADQVEDRRDALAASETAVEAFKRSQLDHSFTSDEILNEHLSALNAQLVQARADRTTQAARLQQIETLTQEDGPLAAAETQDSEIINRLRAARADLLQQDLRLAGTVGAQHPDRKSLTSEIAQIDTVIGQEVENIAQSYRNEISVLEIAKAALTEEVIGIQSEMSNNASATLSLRQMEREAEAARETYQEMLTRLGETRAQAEIQRAEARMVNPAQIPVVPATPRVKLLTAFGATMGLTAGLLIALSLEMVSLGFISSSEIERTTGLHVLTTLPHEDIAKPSGVLDRVNGLTFSLFAERTRQLRTMLDMNAPARRSHAISVLSSLPDEGKTTTSLALARSYALTGKRTLLLDLDTRRSALLHELTSDSLTDLGDYLAGDASLNEVIYSNDTLGFSLAGSSRYAAILADSVSTGVLNDVLDKLRMRFEVIVIDSPPVLAVSDGLEIASISDSILYLVQHRKTSRKSVFYGLSALNHVGLQPTGIVLTKAHLRSDPDHYAGAYTYG